MQEGSRPPRDPLAASRSFFNKAASPQCGSGQGVARGATPLHGSPSVPLTAQRRLCRNSHPVQTILPELKMSAVVRGSGSRSCTAAKADGLYSPL